MSDDSADPVWSPTWFAQQLQEAGESAADQQMELFRRFLAQNQGAGMGGLGPMGMGTASMGTATFKTRVQSGGRISIPDAEREALDIDEGDIVQTVVIPVAKGDSDE